MGWNDLKKVGLRKKKEMPDGLWMRCKRCEGMLYRKVVEDKLNVCPDCNYHFQILRSERIRLHLDEGSFQEVDADMAPLDPLSFVDRVPYAERLEQHREKTQLKDAATFGRGAIKGRKAIIGIVDFQFLGGSMGSVVGEKVSRAVELADAEHLPLVLFVASGGARMQEGAIALMQMAKTSATLAQFSENGGLFISVLTDPTTGGVTASFVALGDIIIAEPGALIGFAGPRVIANTIKRELPEGFQTAEFLLEHGFVDMVVNRSEMSDTLASLFDYCKQE